MSYDLTFVLSDTISQNALTRHFTADKNYDRDGAGGFFYRNENTGVYFQFSPEGPHKAYPGKQLWVFNLNFYRPSFFALEAWPEVERFVRAFKPEVEDDQVGGGGTFGRESFLSGWNTGNRFACSSLSASGASAPATLPAAELRRIWDWNVAVPTLQGRLGDGVFVPRIMFGRVDGKTGCAVVWPDGIACVLPPVDIVIAGRQPPFLARFLNRRPNMFFVPWRTVQPIVESAARSKMSGGYFLNYQRPPAEVAAFVRGLKPTGVTFDGLKSDDVLDAEIAGLDQIGVAGA